MCPKRVERSPKARLTPAALRALAEEGAERSIAKAAAGMGRQAGVAVTAKQAGREIAAWDRSVPALAEAPAETMYCSPDSTGVPMLRRDAGAGKDGGPAKTREAKVAVFHTAERREPEDRAAGAGRGFGAAHGGDRKRPVEGRRPEAVAVRAG